MAHLLQSLKITNIVVTPNFDDFVSRALVAFGTPAVVCDHPATAGRIDPEEMTPQILHIHGRYRFYDSRNLLRESEDHAYRAPEATGTIGQRLDELLSRRSPLVLGYSGWEQDVFMQALKRRLASDLRYNVYWFCYREGDMESLPEWLRDHRNVYFVVPSPSRGWASLADQKLQRSDYGKETFLTADAVLEELFRAFEVDDLPLSKEPLRFLASQLKALLPSNSGDPAADHSYGLSRVVRRIELAADKCDHYWQSVESKLEELFTALRTSRFDAAIVAANGLAVDELDEDQLRRIMEPLTHAVDQLSSDLTNEQMVSKGAGVVVNVSDRLIQQSTSRRSDEVLIGTSLSVIAKALASVGQHDKSLALYDKVIELSKSRGGEDTHRLLSHAWFSKGVALQQQGALDRAVNAYEELAKTVAGTEDPILRALAARGLVNKGAVLGAKGQDTQELEAYETLLSQFRDAKATILRESVARAMVNRGIVLGQMGDTAAEIAAYDEVVETFSLVQIPTIQRQVLRALVGKGLAQEREGDWAGALGTFDRTLTQYGSVDATDLRVLIARTLLAKGVALERLGRTAEALPVYELLVNRYSEAEETSLDELVAAALVNAGAATSKLMTSDDYGRSYFESVITRFQATEEPALRLQLALAWNGLACSRAYEAKTELRNEQVARATELLLRAETAAIRACELDPDLDHAKATRAYVTFLLGREDEARKLATAAIKTGGQVIRDACLVDATTNPIPQDVEFKRMVESIDSSSGESKP